MNHSLSELRLIADQLGISCKKLPKDQLLKKLKNKYTANQSYLKVKQLGNKGKDGTVYLVKDDQGKEYAMKQFKPSKPIDQLIKEIALQSVASEVKISPRIYDYDLLEKFIIMDKLDNNLLDVYTKQGFNLTLTQQRQLIKIFQTLDHIKVFHSDPNPLNFMFKGTKIFIIDFGFAKEIDDEVIGKHTNKPNMKFMIFGFILKIHEQYPQVHLSHLERYLS